MAQRPSSERKPSGWRSKEKNKKGSLSRERASALSREDGKPGRNSGRGNFERFDYTQGKRNSPYAFDIDQKATGRGSYSVNLGQMLTGEQVAAKDGRNFQLEIQFEQEDEIVGEYVVVRKSVFDAMLRDLKKKHNVE